MYIKTFIKKMRRNYYDYGLWVLIRKSAAYMFKPLFENIIMILYRIDLDNISKRQTGISRFRFKWVSPEDKALIQQIEDMEEWLRGQMVVRLSAGNVICLVILEEEQLAGFYLAAFNETVNPLLKMKVVMSPIEVWGEQITICRKYRGIGLSEVLRFQIYSELKERGVKFVYGISRLNNWVSLRSAMQFAPTRAWIIKYRKIMCYRRLICIPLRREEFKMISAGRKIDIGNRSTTKQKIVKPSCKGNGYYFTIRISSFLS